MALKLSSTDLRCCQNRAQVLEAERYVVRAQRERFGRARKREREQESEKEAVPQTSHRPSMIAPGASTAANPSLAHSRAASAAAPGSQGGTKKRPSCKRGSQGARRVLATPQGWKSFISDPEVPAIFQEAGFTQGPPKSAEFLRQHDA
jgi:hypothetical protein